MSKIFISYRRSDSQDSTDRIYEELRPVFGEENIFKDVDSIPGGADFRIEIEKALRQTRVTLVIIGPTWLTATDQLGRRRLDNPADYVRQEVEQSLSRSNILVFPLLVRGAAMPDEKQLPPILAGLAARNAYQVQSDRHFHADMEGVIKVIAGYVPIQKGSSKEAMRGKALLEQSRSALMRSDYASAERDLRQIDLLIREDDLPREAARSRYFQALVRLNGRRPAIQTLQSMRAVEGLMNAAISLHRSGSYLLTLAVFKRDFAKNGLPQLISEARDLIFQAGQVPLDDEDQDNLLLLAQCQPALFRDYFSS